MEKEEKRERNRMEGRGEKMNKGFDRDEFGKIVEEGVTFKAD